MTDAPELWTEDAEEFADKWCGVCGAGYILTHLCVHRGLDGRVRLVAATAIGSGGGTERLSAITCQRRPLRALQDGALTQEQARLVVDAIGAMHAP